MAVLLSVFEGPSPPPAPPSPPSAMIKLNRCTKSLEHFYVYELIRVRKLPVFLGNGGCTNYYGTGIVRGRLSPCLKTYYIGLLNKLQLARRLHLLTYRMGVAIHRLYICGNGRFWLVQEPSHQPPVQWSIQSQYMYLSFAFCTAQRWYKQRGDSICQPRERSTTTSFPQPHCSPAI